MKATLFSIFIAETEAVIRHFRRRYMAQLFKLAVLYMRSALYSSGNEEGCVSDIPSVNTFRPSDASCK